MSGNIRDAVVAWIADRARGRVASARGERERRDTFGWLRGPRGRELFEEARERQLIEDEELAATTRWLREVHLAVGRARAKGRLREVLAKRVPHDSDHHPPLALFSRMLLEAHPGRRRAMSRSLEAFTPELVRALKDGAADLEETTEGIAWLGGMERPVDRREVAAAILSVTEDSFAEVLARAAHGTGEVERWPDLLHLVRGGRFDPLYDRARRFRRLGDRFTALGIRDALGKRARVEPVSGDRLTTDVVPLEVPRDVRILPATIELGGISEREATIAIGRAAAIAWTHPSLSPLVAQPGDVGPAIGALLAHVACDLRAPTELDAKNARVVREHALLVELFELRTEAAAIEGTEDALRRAWRADVDRDVAACVLMTRRGLDTIRWAAPLHAVMRERYDEDWWRNPRAAEPLRGGCERGGAISAEAWCVELGADASTAALRYRELIG